MQLLRPPRADARPFCGRAALLRARSPSAGAQLFCEWQPFCEWQAWPVRPTTVCRLADRLRVRGGLLRLRGGPLRLTGGWLRLRGTGTTR